MWGILWLLLVVGCAARRESLSPGEERTLEGSAPSGIDLDRDGVLYVAEGGRHRIQARAPHGTLLWEIGVFGWRVGELDTPSDVAVAPGGRILYVSESGNRRVQRWDLRSDEKSVLLDRSVESALEPVSLTVARNGDVFVVDVGGRRLWRLSERGVVRWVRGDDLGEPLREPRGLCLDRNGNVLVADAGSGQIVRFDFAGNPLLPAWRSDFLEEPVAVAANRKGEVFVCDRRRPAVLVLDGSGVFVRTLGENQLQEPVDMAISPEGTLFVADRKAHVVWRFQP